MQNVQDATLDAVAEAAEENGLEINLDDEMTLMWIGAIRIAETRSSDDIIQTIQEHEDEMRTEEIVTHRLAAVLNDVFVFGTIPDGTFVYHGPRT